MLSDYAYALPLSGGAASVICTEGAESELLASLAGFSTALQPHQLVSHSSPFCDWTAQFGT